MPDKKPQPPAGKPVMDVIRPGKSAPSPNSKSVIVGSRPMLKDPMMADDTDNSLAKVSSKAKERLLTAPLLETEEPDTAATPDPEVAPKPEASKAKLKSSRIEPPAKPHEPDKPAEPPKLIEALSEDEIAKPEPPKTSEPAPVEHAAPAAPPAPAEPPEPKPAEPAKSEAAPATKPPEEAKPEEPATEEGAEPSSTPPKDQPVETEDDKQAKRQAAVEKLADSKKYYLPINAVEKRRSKHFAIAGIILSLVLIVVWADIAVDAGLIKLPVKPVTHFFSN